MSRAQKFRLKKLYSLTACLEAMLFDLDGTLLDSAPAFVHIVNKMLRDDARPALEAQKIRQNISLGVAGLVKLAYGIDENNHSFKNLCARLFALYEQQLKQNHKPFAHILSLLSYLKKKTFTGESSLTNHKNTPKFCLKHKVLINAEW